jgi:hypothetical protein
VSKSALEFSFGDKLLGYFEGNEHPISVRNHPYMPYRGPGHYEMQVALEMGGKARCHYVAGGTIVEFDVTDCPKYGLLKLASFEKYSDPQQGPQSDANLAA